MNKEQAILDFLKDKKGTILLNDFLKSLYPLPAKNEPPQYLSQSASKELRNLLSKLQAENKITIEANQHLKLGTFYYPDVVTMKTEYYSLNSVQLKAHVTGQSVDKPENQEEPSKK